MVAAMFGAQSARMFRIWLAIPQPEAGMTRHWIEETLQLRIQGDL